MIAEQFAPLDIECLIKTAVELWEEIDVCDLSERQQEVLGRARDAMYADHAGHAPTAPVVTTLVEASSLVTTAEKPRLTAFHRSGSSTSRRVPCLASSSATV